MGRISWGKISARYACTSTFGNLLICRSICMRNCNLDAVIREKSKCEGKDHSILAFNTSNRAPPRRKGSEQLLVLPWTLNDRKKFSRVNLLLTINARRTDIGIRLFGNNMKSIFQFIETLLTFRTILLEIVYRVIFDRVIYDILQIFLNLACHN